MKKSLLLAAILPFVLTGRSFAAEAKLVRYPSYHQGKIAFTYLGDIWTADENGQNVRRITVNKARDVYPRFSPDGRWIAFSSDRAGNLDVYVVPIEGSNPRQLTFHSADDNVLGWTPDSKSVLFASNRGEDFMGKLYTVSINGGASKNAGADMGVWASYSPDGKRLAINRKGQPYWRKFYHGAYQTDVTVMDCSTHKFKDVTEYDGIDSWPMWSTDNHIYFVSDRDGNGLTNIWRVGENGGKAEKVTAFKEGDVRWPSISSDGKVIVFEHDFGIWKLDLSSRSVNAIRLDIATETQENMAEVRDYNSDADDYDLAPNGRRVAFSIHGEIFTAPTDEGELRQITDSPARDKEPLYSPDGKWIAFISDKSGREEIYLANADGSGEAQKITDMDTLKSRAVWAPESKRISFITSDSKLIVYDLEAKQIHEVAASKYGPIGSSAWSPDGKWIAFSKPEISRVSQVFLVPSAGGEEHKVSFEPVASRQPRFSADGRKLYFTQGDIDFAGGQQTGTMQLYAVSLEREDRDPSEPEERADAADTAGTGARFGQRQAQPVQEVHIDWAGLKRRTHAVTRVANSVTAFEPSPDGRTIAFVTMEGAGFRGTPVLYTIQDDGKRLTRVTSGAAPNPEDDGAPRGRGGFGGGINSLHLTRDGRTIYFKEGTGIFSVAVGGGPSLGGAPAGRGGAPSGAAADAAKRRVSYTAKVKIDQPAEWAEMFDDAWRTMKYGFYDAKMHGKDWDAARAKYRPLVACVGDRQELLNIVNEMIGELNASHTGTAPPPGGRSGGVATAHLGVDLEPDDSAGRYKVAYVYEDGPADKDWVKLAVGDYLLAIDGKPVKAGDDYWKLLNSRLNRKVELTINKTPSEEGAWKTKVEPTNMAGFANLRYERWVKQRREEVSRLSNGQIGYLHIKAMDQPSLQRFQRELREYRDKKAMVIDQRWNGGGNIEQELLAILVQREYQIWQPRGTEETGRPFAGYFGPKVVLQNWRSASNAEMFPAGFRALGLGKVIGTPTMGAVIGTGSYSLIDGSTVRTPGVGVYLADAKHTNMENYGVKPDIYVENSPEDNLANRDRQLETAVAELMKQIR